MPTQPTPSHDIPGQSGAGMVPMFLGWRPA